MTRIFITLFLLCSFSAAQAQTTSSSSHTIEDLVIGVAKAYNNADTTMIKNLFISEEEYIEMVKEQWEKQPPDSTTRKDVRKYAIDDYNIQLRMSTMVFNIDVQKYNIFNIKVDTESPEYEEIDYPAPVRAKLLLTHLKHEKYKFLLFMAIQTKTGWHLAAPIWRTTEERPDLSELK